MVVGGAGAMPTTRAGGPTHGRQDRWIVAALAGLAVALSVVATWHGPGLTDDSVNYLSTGRNVADGRGALMLADQPLTGYPPGLPAVVATAEAVGVGGQSVLRLLSVASFAAIVVLGHRVLTRVVDHRGVVLGATLLLAVSPALLGVSTMAWSEPPFIAVSLLFLLVLGRVCGARTLAVRDLVILAGLCWAAFLLRYIGLSLLATGGIVLLIALRPLDRRSLLRIVAFGALSLVGPVAVALRNHAADGTYLGNRLPSHDTVAGVLHRVGVSIGGWVLPTTGASTRLLVAIAVGVSLALVAGLLYAVRGGAGPDAAGGLAPTAQPQLLCCGAFVAVYTAYLGGAALSTAFEPLNSRYLSPVYVPLVVIGSAGIAAALTRTTRATVRVAVGAALLVGIGGQLVVSVGDATDGANDGIGWNGRGYVDSEVAARTAEIVAADEDAVVYSNLPGALWAATRIQPLYWAPRDAGFRGVPTTGELDALARNVACRWPATYLTLYFFGRPSGIGIEQMREVLDVEQVAVAGDGAVWRLARKGDVDCTDPPPTCSMDSVRWRCEGNRTARALWRGPSADDGRDGGAELGFGRR